MDDIKIVKEGVYGKYTFDEAEKKDMAEAMALAFSEKTDLELKKKEVASQIKGEIDAVDAKLNTLSRHYNQGYKFTEIECRVEYDYIAKEVRAYREDTGEHVSTRTMSQTELQKEMFDRDGHAITAPEEGEETPPKNLTELIEDGTNDQELFKEEELEEEITT